jgi:hypothetical protein
MIIPVFDQQADTPWLKHLLRSGDSVQVQFRASQNWVCTWSTSFDGLEVAWSTSFGGLEVACWPLVPKFAGSNSAEAVRFFKGEKILSTPTVGEEVKPSVPCHRFAAHKRSLNVTWKLSFRQYYRILFSPISSTFRCLDLSRRVGRGGIWRRQWESLKQGGTA